MRVIQQAILALGVAGCAAAPELVVVEQSVTDPTPNYCFPSICGANSPGIDARGFHSVSKSGRGNEAGFRLVGFTKDRETYQVDVTHGYLTGISSARLPRLAGQHLVGAQLELERNGEPAIIRVARVGAMRFPVGAAEPIETYVLEYLSILSGGWKNLCAGATLRDVVDPGPDGLGMQPDESILFENDRIDLGTKTVATEPDPDWFTIGCSGHVLAKLHLTRNTIASTSSVPGAVSFAWRQATLKMLTADYCGDGTAFTVAGQRLTWKGDLVDWIAPPETFEAQWDEHGALCLDTPRMAVPTTRDGEVAFPDIEAAIAAHCQRPPPCREHDPDGEQRVSGNPAPYGEPLIEL